MNALLSFLSSIPEVVWAAGLASVITLLGVHIQNRGEKERQLQQLKHDSEQRDRDREMSLRRDVYLRAAENVAAGQQFLGAFSQLEVPFLEIAQRAQQTDGSALMKVHLVGNPEVIGRFQEYGESYFGLLLNLMERRLKAELAQLELRNLQENRDRLLRDRENALASLKLIASDNRVQATVIQAQFERVSSFQAPLDQAASSIGAATRQLQNLRTELSLATTDAVLKLQTVAAEVNVAVRSHLGKAMDDPSGYLGSVEGSYQKMQAQFEDVLRRWNEEYGQE